MSNKGINQSLATRRKISLENGKDKAKILSKIKQYTKDLKINQFPSITDAAIYSGISEKRLVIYEQSTPDNSDIREALDYIRDLQKSKLQLKGLDRTYDSKITTLLLKANHGLKEEPANLTQNNTFNVSPELLAKAIDISRKSPISKDLKEV